MNLIENLGGYESAKSKARDNGSLHSERLKKALLEYRREHGIFEVGDSIVSNLENDEEWVKYVCEITAFHKKMAITKHGDNYVHHYVFRHATDEEIKAGHRL